MPDQNDNRLAINRIDDGDKWMPYYSFRSNIIRKFVFESNIPICLSLCIHFILKKNVFWLIGFNKNGSISIVYPKQIYLQNLIFFIRLYFKSSCCKKKQDKKLIVFHLKQISIQKKSMMLIINIVDCGEQILFCSFVFFLVFFLVFALVLWCGLFD